MTSSLIRDDLQDIVKGSYVKIDPSPAQWIFVGPIEVIDESGICRKDHIGRLPGGAVTFGICNIFKPIYMSNMAY